MSLNVTSCHLKRCLSHFCIVAIGTLFPLAGYSQQPASTGTTTTLKRESIPAAQAQQEKQAVERYHSREGRMQAKPLDWSSTIGKPRSVKRPPVRGKPATSQPGTPNPDAKREGQRLHPEDWPNLKKGGPQGRLDGKPRLLPVGSPDVFTQYCENCLVPNTDWPFLPPLTTTETRLLVSLTGPVQQSLTAGSTMETYPPTCAPSSWRTIKPAMACRFIPDG